MSEQSLRRASRLLDLETALPWLTAAGIGLLLLALAPRLLSDPDTYSHIALGRWIAAHQAVPWADPLSQTMRGAPWIAFEWLSQLALASAFSLGGWPGVVALTMLAAALAFGLLAQALGRVWQPNAVVVAVLAALILIAPHLLARPHVLAMPLMTAWFASLIRSNDEARPPDWRLLPAMTVWANLHGSFIFGLAMLAPLALEALYRADAGGRARVLRQWCVFGLLAVAAACVNPYGPSLILVLIRTVALGDALNIIIEWRPQDFSHLAGYEIVLLSAFAGALVCGVRLPLLRVLMLLGLVHLSLAQVRHTELLGLIAPLLLARPLTEQFRSLATTRFDKAPSWPSPAPLLVALAIVLGAALRPDIAPLRAITPEKAVRAADLRAAGPVLNEYAFGGYLDFVGIAPFIDGRGELYGGPYLLRYRHALDLQNVGDLDRLLDEYKIRTTLLRPQTPAVALLDRMPGWRRIYSDEIAVVHQRISPAR
jgi:hypothetical protein